ncbi:cytochrome d ubiquinol oxidase subunit II [Lactobacillaceae bacterium 24-114]
MSFLQLLWFVLIGVLFAGFFFLDGFDYGVGMAAVTLTDDEAKRDQIIRTIGPVWDGNEVWLITAGGAMFASFPYWYASLFSGYYIILMLVLVGLIIRGVSFTFRADSPMPQKKIWDWALGIGSFMAPFFLGIMFISMIQGMPIDANGNFHATFFDYINWFSVVGGIALTLLTYLHGLNYITLKTVGEVKETANNVAQFLYWILYLGLIVFALMLIFMTDFMQVHPVATIVMLVIMVLLTIVAHGAAMTGKEMLAFISSGLTLIALVVLLFVGLFPRVLISSISPRYDLLIQNASSTEYTLTVMTIATCCLLPFVLAYTIWAYWIFRKRIQMPVIAEAK